MGIDALSISDEEFLKQDPSTFLDDEPQGKDEGNIENSSTNIDDEIPPAPEVEEEISEAQEQTELDQPDDEVRQPDGDTLMEQETSEDDEDPESLDTSIDNSTDTDGDTQETTEFDYESAYKKVTEPFKANGTEMRVTDPQDIVTLMQMGANYQKKMAQMKPNLKMIKMLEKNDLLDETKLSNLIDLSKKDPKAVAKLIQESGIDPLDIDTAGSADYRPTDYSVTDKEYNLDQVLEDIKSTETFDRTINVLTKEWDNESKATISDNPDIIRVINDHMSNGVFDKVNEVLQQEKTLGKLVGVSDVEAYRQVAEAMHSQGLLVSSQEETQTKPVSRQSESNSTVERKQKRKAVAPVKQAAPTKTSEEDNFLGLSDEEFMKKFGSR